MERQIINWLAANIPRRADIEVGIGDDAAVVRWPDKSLVVTTDALVDGVHFKSEEHSATRIGYKSVAVNLSDLAAMGAVPTVCVVSLVLPHGTSLEFVQQLYGGMSVLAEQFNFTIAGGDTNFADSPLMLSVAAIGRVVASPWCCNGADVGDLVFVSGDFGGSLLGNHLDFVPRLDLVQWLSTVPVNAATDVSDGLIVDLNHILRSSGCGAEIDLKRVPVSKAARQMSKLDQTPAIDHALFDGEDFELVVVVSPQVGEKIEASKLLRKNLTRIGKVVETPGITTYDEQGALIEIAITGFEHH